MTREEPREGHALGRSCLWRQSGHRALPQFPVSARLAHRAGLAAVVLSPGWWLKSSGSPSPASAPALSAYSRENFS